jgi:hypothetical protein
MDRVFFPLQLERVPSIGDILGTGSFAKLEKVMKQDQSLRIC